MQVSFLSDTMHSSQSKIGLLLQADFALKYADNVLHAIGNLYAEQ